MVRRRSHQHPGSHDADLGGAARAAEYVRMSTDHQKYSTENQAEAIRQYAARRGLEIVRTYADEGKSGLRLDGRPSRVFCLIGDGESQDACDYDPARRMIDDPPRYAGLPPPCEAGEAG